jgi:DHA2 family multidrug resistance protein
MLGIASGASIGGWLSEYHGWRSIFYISLPMSGFIFLAVGLSLPEKKAEQNPPFDFFGLVTFSLGMIGLQMLLERGERLEWFASARSGSKLSELAENFWSHKLIYLSCATLFSPAKTSRKLFSPPQGFR